MQERSGPCFTCGRLVLSPTQIELLEERDGSDEAQCLRDQLKQDFIEYEIRFETARDIGRDPIDEFFDQLYNIQAHESFSTAESAQQRVLQHGSDRVRHRRIIDESNDYFSEVALLTSKSELERRRNERKRIEEENKARSEKRLWSYNERTGEIGMQSSDAQQLDIYEELRKRDYEAQQMRVAKERDAAKALQPDSSSIIGVIEELESMHIANDRHNGVQTSEKLDVIKERAPIRLEHVAHGDDRGVVLTVRQPFASFIVMGIKKHEGRSWATSHRGRLWIRSSSFLPSADEIVRIEKFYCDRLGYPLVFPMQYATNCLLGAVFLDDCLHQGEYVDEYSAKGEVDDPYAWILSSPEILENEIPISVGNGMRPTEGQRGNHQLNRIESRILRYALSRLTIHQYASKFA